MKFRPKIDEHDYTTKTKHVERFLNEGSKVKITIMFRGREVTHPERGTALLERLAEELSDIGVVEQTPIQDGRNMTMMLAPSKAVLAADKTDGADANVTGDGTKEPGEVAEPAEPRPPEVAQETPAASADAA
jgi:translation initiation factor IF-3